MRRPPHSIPISSQRGASLIELLIALLVLALGILALGQLFPAGTRGQLKDRMMTTGSLYAQEKIEQLAPLNWSSADLTVGRHPAGVATEALGNNGAWKRFYQVDVMDAPLDNLKKITVTVSWNFYGRNRSVTATTYVRR
jgi:type IV pilus assembly protein PilV